MQFSLYHKKKNNTPCVYRGDLLQDVDQESAGIEARRRNGRIIYRDLYANQRDDVADVDSIKQNIPPRCI